MGKWIIGATIIVLIVGFFTGVWFTMIRNNYPEAETTESVSIQKIEKHSNENGYKLGEPYVEKDMDGNEIFRLEVNRVDQIPGQEDLPELEKKKKYIGFEIYSKNFDEAAIDFKPYYSKLKVNSSHIKPEEFVIIDQDGWNKYWIKGGGSFRIVLIYAIDRNAKEMTLIITPEFSYKDLLFKVDNTLDSR
ncbi:hypothetical protein [Anaerobacillus sp. 1_MG-2023]|uniref:hypothetical protein n=1 Tax=Anaerobacillus sp. 1_MG-2023 TaxID=3062655 RepID=UPI0026E269C6|nr:hypothetical protein [Anaerobacillus sp. 1_MG-2023]MDO6655914.1 hypothetical protein [Anaerobacillus sp. 1_MG-2023]